MKIAVFGYGSMGQLHLAMYKSLGVEIAYLVGRNESELSKIAKQYKVPYTTNPSKVYADKSIVGVDICVPTAFHFQSVVPALKAGKHVMCEMPIAFNIDEAEQMTQEAKVNKKILLVATLMPFVSDIKYITDLIKKKVLGKVIHLSLFRYHRPYKKINPVIELMTFEIDTLLRILGMPRTISAKANTNHIVAIFECNSQTASIEMVSTLPTDMPVSHGIKVVCEKGIIESTTVFTKPEPEPPQVRTTIYYKNGQQKEINIASRFPYKEECRYFIDCLKGNENGGYLSGEKALQDLKVALAITKSLQTNTQIKV